MSTLPSLIQLAIFIENRAGRLAEVCRTLANRGFNIVGFSVADEEGYGIFRLIVSEPVKAQEVLREAGFTVRSRPVICARVPHRPGGLAESLDVFSRANLNVEYMYAIADTLIVFAIDDLEAGLKALHEADIEIRDPFASPSA